MTTTAANDYITLCKVTTSTTGTTSPMALGSAATGFRGAGANLVDGKTYAYAIAGASGLYETGFGVSASSGTTLTRVPITSSNANALVTLAGGETVILGIVLAEDFNAVRAGTRGRVLATAMGYNLP